MRLTRAIVSTFLLFGTMDAGNAAAEEATLVALGDSLTAGYQLDPGKGFAPKLEEALRAKGYDVKVVDAGVSGDTSSGGLARLDWSVGEDADAVILELGANDALRGIDPSLTRKNLTAMIERLKQRGVPVLLAGMMAPPNMGPEYGEAFNSIYPDLSREYDVRLYPFFLDGIAADPSLNLSDGMHPNDAGVEVIVARILPAVESLLADAGVPVPSAD